MCAACMWPPVSRSPEARLIFVDREGWTSIQCQTTCLNGSGFDPARVQARGVIEAAGYDTRRGPDSISPAPDGGRERVAGTVAGGGGPALHLRSVVRRAYRGLSQGFSGLLV